MIKINKGGLEYTVEVISGKVFTYDLVIKQDGKIFATNCRLDITNNVHVVRFAHREVHGSNKLVNGFGVTKEEYEILQQELSEIISFNKQECESQYKKFKQDLESGNSVIAVSWLDGEYFQGWIHDLDDKGFIERLLKEFKNCGDRLSLCDSSVVINDGNGKGHIDYNKLVERYNQVVAAKAKMKADEEKRIAEIFDKAKKTGEKQLIKSWSEECNDPREACDIDTICIWAMPDGSTKETRSHNW